MKKIILCTLLICAPVAPVIFGASTAVAGNGVGG
jgi:hypothetical protein